MTITALRQKDRNGEPMVRVERLQAIGGFGIRGDANAAAASPRQVLIVSCVDLERYALEPGDLRENIAIAGSVDQLVSGSLVQIGTSCVVRVTFTCEPCSKLNSVRRGLAYELDGNARGILGRIVRSGVLKVGDSIKAIPGGCRPLSDSPRERLWDAVGRIPAGLVATYSALVLGIGVPKAFIRAIPRLLKKGPSHLPIHRVLDSQARLIVHHVPGQRERLLGEGTPFCEDGQVHLTAMWNPASLYTNCELAVCG